MSRILVIGGYGGFGARLSRRLVAGGHHVLVGGRSRERAESFCDDLPGSQAVVIDRTRDLGPLLDKLKPDILIDAAGPFQGSSYTVPQACIRAGVHYLDLADARDFVTGIATLDSAAKAAGAVVISGASTVPALSSAVAINLASDLERVEKVDMALSAATHSTANPAVAKAVLSYLGRRIPRSSGPAVYGWQGIQARSYRMPGVAPLHRLVAMVDVPDYDLLKACLPGESEVEFRAGTDVSFHMLALWLASWPFRWGWLSSIDPFIAGLVRLQRFSSIGGGDRSAMDVRLTGLRHGRRVERRWTLIAEDFQGPEIPTLAAALLANDLGHRVLQPGAGTAAGLLSLSRFEQAFEDLAIHHVTEELCPTEIDRLTASSLV
jgi:NAD(P)-dependent dehydrogenase (short-subunit alcohol dehydrogenase family)